MTALERYNEHMKGDVEPDPIERLRFFLSLAITGQDWLDVEQFIDVLRHQLATIRATWLSPEAYETLMRERSETLHELAQYRRDFDYSQTELYAALAAIKLKDEALSKIEYLEASNGSILSASECSSIATEALAITINEQEAA